MILLSVVKDTKYREQKQHKYPVTVIFEVSLSVGKEHQQDTTEQIG